LRAISSPIRAGHSLKRQSHFPEPALINGVIAVPIMAVMMTLGANREVMGTFTIRRRLKILGWLATLIMGAAVVAMVVV